MHQAGPDDRAEQHDRPDHAAEAGGKYRFKAMIKRTGPQWAGAHVVDYEEGAKFVRSAALNSTKRGQWETLETTFTSHANPRSSAIYLYNYDPENPAYFDGLELKEIAK